MESVAAVVDGAGMEASNPGIGAREHRTRVAANRLRRLKRSGASDDELLLALEQETDYERAFRLGADGEERVGRVLDGWSERGAFAVLHDLVPIGKVGNVDHVAVGAAGVTVIDTKAWSGAVRVRSDGLWIGPHSHRRELAKLAGQVTAVRSVLDAAGLGAMPVRGVLCLANENEGCPADELLTIDDLGVGRPEVVGRLAGVGGPYDRAVIELVLQALQQGFTVRGGGRPAPQVLVPVPSPSERPASSPKPRRASSGGPAVASPAAIPPATRRPAPPSGWHLRLRRKLLEALVTLALAVLLLSAVAWSVPRVVSYAVDQVEAVLGETTRSGGQPAGKRNGDGVGSRHERAREDQQRRR